MHSRFEDLQSVKERQDPMKCSKLTEDFQTLAKLTEFWWIQWIFMKIWLDFDDFLEVWVQNRKYHTMSCLAELQYILVTQRCCQSCHCFTTSSPVSESRPQKQHPESVNQGHKTASWISESVWISRESTVNQGHKMNQGHSDHINMIFVNQWISTVASYIICNFDNSGLGRRRCGFRTKNFFENFQISGVTKSL